MHFSSCKSVSTKATRSPPSLNSLNRLQFMSRKRIDFPSSLPLCVRGRCFDSVLDQMGLPGHARGSATFLPDIVWAPLAPGTMLVLLTVSAGYTRILLPLPHGTFLKLQSYAPGQRLFCRHHWSACSSVVPTLLSASFPLVCRSAPLPNRDAVTSSLHFIQPGSLCSHALLTDQVLSSHKRLLRWHPKDSCQYGRQGEC